MLFLDIFVAAVILFFSFSLAARHSVALLEKSLTNNLKNVAQLLATSESIKGALEAGEVSPQLAEALDLSLESLTDIDVFTIADMRAIRLYHPEKSRVGQKFVGGDEGPALLGRNYHSIARGTLGQQSRYFYPVFNDQGKQIGFVHVSVLMDNVNALRDEVYLAHLKTLGLVFVVSTALIVLLSISIKRSLLGYEPFQISRIFLQRQEVIDSLEEGLLAIDQKGGVILVNSAAASILDLKDQAILGRDIDAILPRLGLKESLDGRKEHNVSLVTDNFNVICNKLPIQSHGRLVGALAIIRDRSEMTHLAEQITGFNHLLDALRANTHEFKNQLHVILGLLRSGDSEAAGRYIAQNCQFQGETLTTIAQNIENRTLGALIIGKINRSNELGILMNVASDSRIPRHSRFLSTKSLVTVVGNLVENAIDAIDAIDWESNDNSQRPKEISLLIHEDDQGLIIAVDDTGVGLTPAEKSRLGEPGFTTKGQGRGLGLSLLKAILESSHGQMSVDSEKDVGTTFELVFREPRNKKGETA
ncbi:MAG: GHKL domain-containing protein [Deltaproteobacteria bacterium]|nr:GHKL domain-containing protein [Deltaproteobacteria bacterium]